MNAPVPPVAMDGYAVFGNPIAHSRSPAIHAAFARQTGQQMQYDKRLVPLGGFAAALQDFIASGGCGANVTLPFKLDAFAAATRLTARAAAAGAVNTLQIQDGYILGDNTDGVGLVTDLQVNAGIALRGRRVLLLGAGGAAQGALLPIMEAAPAQLVLANRTADKAMALVARFSQACPGQPRQPAVLQACRLEQIDTPFDIVINATAASLSQAVPAVSPRIFAAHTLAYDMMYGSTPTAFLDFAASHGAATRDGLGMLVEQAAEAFLVWRGIRPQTGAVLAMLRETL